MIFAPNASVEIVLLPAQVPIIYYTDLSWADIVDYYPYCTDLFDFAREEGERLEASAMNKAAALIFPSPWAVTTARQLWLALNRCAPGEAASGSCPL